MSEELDDSQDSFGDFRDLFPNFTPEIILELSEKGFVREEEINYMFTDEVEPVTKSGLIIEFTESLNQELQSKLEFTIDKDTGKIYTIYQNFYFPINNGLTASIELNYMNHENDTPTLDFTFISGEVPDELGETEGLKNIYVEFSAGHEIGEASDSVEEKITFNFENGANSYMKLGNKMILTSVVISKEGEVIYDHFQDGLLFALQHKNKYPINKFYRQQDPLEIRVEKIGEKTEFGGLVPGVMEITGSYEIKLIPNLLDLFINGNHRPIIPFNLQFKVLR